MSTPSMKLENEVNQDELQLVNNYSISKIWDCDHERE